MADRLNISLVPSLEAGVDFLRSIGFVTYNQEYKLFCNNYISSTGEDFVAFLIISGLHSGMSWRDPLASVLL